jgi:hypothetical protein
VPDPTPDEAAALLRVAEQQLDLWKAECRALERERDSLRAREQAVRDLADDLPDLLQTYAWSHQDGTWAGYAEFVAGKLRAALGPVETPQEETRG